MPGFVLEERLPCGVAEAWAAMASVLGTGLMEVGGEHAFRLDKWTLVERTIEVDPPRRRVYRIVSGAPVAGYMGTTELKPDSDGCRLRWAVVAEPSDEPSEAFVARAELAVQRGIELVVAEVRRPRSM